MKIAIVGAGFTGLTAAWRLAQAGHNITVYEQNNKAGGLAAGFREEKWDWTLERHYHHVFQTDRDIKSFLQELDLIDELFFINAATSIYYDECIERFDSPLSLLLFPKLSLIAKFRTGVVLAFLKLYPFGQSLEKYPAENFIKKTMGLESWQVLWEPLFKGKFGQYSSKINAAWFWARIYARSQQLGYFKGGFQSVVDLIVQKLKAKKVEFKFNSEIQSIKKAKSVELTGSRNLSIQLANKKKLEIYDQVLFTSSSKALLALVKGLNENVLQKIKKLKSLGAATLVLQLNKPFFSNKIYWLNINEKKWPFLAVVEHTNFVGTQFYDNKHILYVGKYLDVEHKNFKLSKKELLNLYTPFLEKLSPGFSESIVNTWLFKDEFAQPIAGLHHSQQLPNIKTHIPGLFWAGMQHVYPFDRGVNYAVRLGGQAASLMLNNKSNNQ